MTRAAMRYRALDDGRVYEAATAADPRALRPGEVDRLRAVSFMEHGDAADFMANMAANCAAWDGTIIRPNTAEHFVEDLVGCRLPSAGIDQNARRRRKGAACCLAGSARATRIASNSLRSA